MRRVFRLDPRQLAMVCRMAASHEPRYLYGARPDAAQPTA